MIDYSFGNWIAANCDAETIDRWNEHVQQVEVLRAKANALAEALTPFAASLERYSGFTEYALFGLWEDVNGAAGRKLNILRKANFDDARETLDAYRATEKGGV